MFKCWQFFCCSKLVVKVDPGIDRIKVDVGSMLLEKNSLPN